MFSSERKNRALFEMMVSADSFLLQESLGSKPRPEVRQERVAETAFLKPVITGRIAHTFTDKGAVIHFEDHDVHVDLVEI